MFQNELFPLLDTAALAFIGDGGASVVMFISDGTSASKSHVSDGTASVVALVCDGGAFAAVEHVGNGAIAVVAHVGYGAAVVFLLDKAAVVHLCGGAADAAPSFIHGGGAFNQGTSTVFLRDGAAAVREFIGNGAASVVALLRVLRCGDSDAV